MLGDRWVRGSLTYIWSIRPHSRFGPLGELLSRHVTKIIKELYYKQKDVHVSSIFIHVFLLELVTRVLLLTCQSYV